MTGSGLGAPADAAVGSPLVSAVGSPSSGGPTTTPAIIPPTSTNANSHYNSSGGNSKVQDVVPFAGRFPSWEAFDVARKAHCEKTHTMYVCRNTVKVEVANKRRKLQVPASWVYDRKVYVCTHGYKRVSRSNGARPRQNVRYTNCKARFTASVVVSEVVSDRPVLCIQVTGQRLEHDDHPVSLEHWRNYSQNRAAIIEHPYLAHEAELLRRTGSGKRLAREHMETLSGRVCTMKDMHNLYARLKKREDGRKTTSALAQTGASVRVESVLQQFVDAHVENHASLLAGDDGCNEAICLASKAMKEHFAVFPELVMLDVTIIGTAAQANSSSSSSGNHNYNQNHNSSSSNSNSSNAGRKTPGAPLDGMMDDDVAYPPPPPLPQPHRPFQDAPFPVPPPPQQQQQLFGFLCMDALGNSKPVFLAPALHSSPALLRRVCQDFKRTHPLWTRIKVLVMEKLLPEVVEVLAHEFPHARLLLCQFHVVKFLSSLISQAEFGVPQDFALQEQVRELVQRLVFARSEREYGDSKALLAQLLRGHFDVFHGYSQHPLVAHIDQHWEPYRHLWTSYWRVQVFEFSFFFTKGMECFWNPLKSAFERTGGIASTGAVAGVAGAAVVAAAAAVAAGCETDLLIPDDPHEEEPQRQQLSGSGGDSLEHGGGHVLIPSSSGRATSMGMAATSSGLPSGGAHSGGVTLSGGNASLARCISEVLTMVRFIEEEWTAKMLILEMTKPVTEFSSDPLLHFMVNCLSAYAVTLVSSQVSMQTAHAAGTVSITKMNRARTPQQAHQSAMDHQQQFVGMPMHHGGAYDPIDAHHGQLAHHHHHESHPHDHHHHHHLDHGAMDHPGLSHGPTHDDHDHDDDDHHHPHHPLHPLHQHQQQQQPPHHHGVEHEHGHASSSGLVRWFDRATKKRHVLQRDASGCDCEFYDLYHLPCEHLIYYEVSVLKHKQLSMSAVGHRWFLRTFQIPKIVSQRESNEIEYHIL